MAYNSGGQPLYAPRSSRYQISELAKKYSHPRGRQHRVIKHSGISGLTPLSPFRPNTALPHRQRKNELYRYQEGRYKGFVASELAALDSYSAFNLEAARNNLMNPIHPLYEKQKWQTRDTLPRHLAFLPIGGEYEGLWEANNPVVWNILQPCLQACSRILENCHTWPWFDALLNSTFRPINPSRRSRYGVDQVDLNTFNNYRLSSFHQRAPDQVWNDREATQRKLKSLSDFITLGLWSGHADDKTGMPEPTGFYETGRTDRKAPWDFEKAHIWISIEILQPLLFDDLTDSERMAVQLRVVATVLHESAHALHELDKIRNRHLDTQFESYFEGEVLNEVGWSLEQALWNGQPREIVDEYLSDNGPGLPPMGYMCTSWFNEGHPSQHTRTIPIDPEVPHNPLHGPNPCRTAQWFPIPATWCHQFFQPEFWVDVVRALGERATYAGPLTMGMSEDLRRNWYNKPWFNYTRRMSWYANPDNPYGMWNQIPLTANMSQEERKAFENENERRRQACNVLALVQSVTQNATTFGPLRDRHGPDSESDDSASSGNSSVSEPEDLIGQNPQKPPRWDEIRDYLIANKAPLQLALDSLYFSIPEPTLYGYILAHGGLKITSQEFRNFMIYCTSQRTLFSGDYTHSHVGVITKLPEGWPEKPFRPLDFLPTAPKPNATHKTTFETIIQSGFLQRDLEFWQDFRDIDSEVLRGIVNYLASFAKPPLAPIPEDQWWFLIVQCAREGDVADPGRYFTLGPKGVVRFVEEKKGREGLALFSL